MYREIKPPPELGSFVECFWTSEVATDCCRRILPDGCIDILFFACGGRFVDAQVVGAMTRFQDVRLQARQSILGIRFHPGMAGAYLTCDVSSLNNRSVPFQDLLGRPADMLLDDLRHCSSVEGCIETLTPRLVTLPTVSEVQQAIWELVEKRGQLALADFADAAGLSDRQLRRCCAKHSGLPPKQLARILRFRHASRLLGQGVPDLAGLAIDCGYYDQAHMIRDFRELAGISPARFMRQLSADDRFVQ